MDTQLLSKYVDTTNRKRDLEAELKQVNETLETMETAIVDSMADEGVTRISVNGATIYLAKDVRVGPRDGDYDRLSDALTICEYGELVQRRPNLQTLSAWYRERLAAGDTIEVRIADALAITERWRARVRKEAAKEPALATTAV